MKTVESPILIIPGWSNSGPLHWQSVWESEIPSCIRVEQRDWLNPKLEDWVTTIDDAVRQATQPVVLVAHSLGCIAVAHWAVSFQAAAGEHVNGALLVAPADVEAITAPSETRNFGPILLRPLPFRSLLVASRTDMYCRIDRAQAMASAWESELIDVGDAGHINTDSGHGLWPVGKQYLHRLIAHSSST